MLRKSSCSAGTASNVAAKKKPRSASVMHSFLRRSKMSFMRCEGRYSMDGMVCRLFAIMPMHSSISDGTRDTGSSPAGGCVWGVGRRSRRAVVRRREGVTSHAFSAHCSHLALCAPRAAWGGRRTSGLFAGFAVQGLTMPLWRARVWPVRFGAFVCMWVRVQ